MEEEGHAEGKGSEGRGRGKGRGRGVRTGAGGRLSACSKRPVPLTGLPASVHEMLMVGSWHLLQIPLLSPKAAVTLLLAPRPQWLHSLVLLVPGVPRASAEG